MISNWTEDSGKSRGYRLLTRLKAAWLVLASRNFVALSCDLRAGGDYGIQVRFVGLTAPSVPIVVGEWVEAAINGNGLVTEAHKILKG